MKYAIFTMTLSAFSVLLAPSVSQAEVPGFYHNAVLTGPIYGGGVTKEQQKLSLGSRNQDQFIGRKTSSGKNIRFGRKNKKR